MNSMEDSMQRKQVLILTALAGGIILSLSFGMSRSWSTADQAQVVINEVLVDPATGDEGDANGDGVRDTYEDEFIELVNRGSVPVDISGWELGPAGASPYMFPEGAFLAPGEYTVLFGGGQPTGLPCQAYTSGGRIGSGLSNALGRILLIDPAGPDTLQDLTYENWDEDSAFTRSPEGWGEFIKHLAYTGARFSPGGPPEAGGGPDQSRPAVYRLRIVNLTSAGYQVAWRTGDPADARIEVESGGVVRHHYDPSPAGLLHLAGLYGLEPETVTEWRVVSGGTIAPADSFQLLVTGEVVTSVPYTVYGELIGGGSGQPVSGAHIFLRAGNGSDPSGWLLARSDSLGLWNLNLGNLRTDGGEGYSWSNGDTLWVEADGGSEGVASGAFHITGSSPQELVLLDLTTDPAPFFSWSDVPAGTSADSTITLSYTLTDQGNAWAQVYMRYEGEGERLPLDTEPALLPKADPGSVEISIGDLPEGRLCWISAGVEDGLNPPLIAECNRPIRIAHSTRGSLAVPAGITLFTPTLSDTGMGTARGLLGRLDGDGEVARWDVTTASWISASRLQDDTFVGEDFTLGAGEGYALVSAEADTILVNGPRRYSPAALNPGTGLALVGISDSTSVRKASDVLVDISVSSVSRWDRHKQAWRGLFRLSGGDLAGEDFLVEWGEAVAIDVDPSTTWQPAGSLGRKRTPRGEILLRPPKTGRHMIGAGGSALLAGSTAAGVVTILWNAAPAASLHLESAGGSVRWREPVTSGNGWHKTRITGLAPGVYRVVLKVPDSEGDLLWIREVLVEERKPPSMPVWAWGPAPDSDGPLILEMDGMWIETSSDGKGGWYTAISDLITTLPEGETYTRLVELTGDGGWISWPLTWNEIRPRLITFSSAGAPLSVSGLEIEEPGPMAVDLRWQVLHAEEIITFQPFLGYSSSRGGGGPLADARIWVEAGPEEVWEPGNPPALFRRVGLCPGPEGQRKPEAAAIRIRGENGNLSWIGPGALVVESISLDLKLLPAVPNPFNPETVLRYSLPPGGEHTVRLEVRDVRGRLTKLLLEARQGGGNYQVSWDGSDTTGRRVAAGVYLVLLEVDGVRLTRKVILLK